jgi:hypothetical protein
MPISYKDLLIGPDELVLKPAITEWHRLEADPTALDLAPGLEARIADPLWQIGRQWQLGELRGEDAGSPIQVYLSGSSSRLDLRQTNAPPEDAAETVWEPHVEAEPDPIGAYATLSAEAGIDFERCLAADGATALIAVVRQAFRLAGLDGLKPRDRQQALLLELLREAAIDGAALLLAFVPLRGPDGRVTALPARIAVPPELAEASLRAANAWLVDWADMFMPPIAPATWIDRRLEYRFDIDTDAQGANSLHVEEYANGRLDWWSMDFGTASPGPSAEAKKVAGMRIPMPVRYAGMPADRYFEFEDGSVNLAATSGGPTSIATMMMLEYIFAASNDWFHLPLTLEYGHSFTVDKLTVTDTFGRFADIGRAGKGAGGWCMFEISMAGSPQESGPTFVLPAVVAQTIEGDPIEEVALFRDEIANLVWATERVVPGIGPKGLSRQKDAQVVHQALDTAGLTDAAYVYRMQTPVPLTWHPMVAIQDPERPLGTVLFRRKLLRRTIINAEGAMTTVDGAPQGLLLRGQNGVFEVEENEVPRAGVVLTRSFQMARTADGQRLLWLGRTKRVGSGEGSSALRFDVLTRID